MSVRPGWLAVGIVVALVVFPLAVDQTALAITKTFGLTTTEGSDDGPRSRSSASLSSAGVADDSPVTRAARSDGTGPPIAVFENETGFVFVNEPPAVPTPFVTPRPLVSGSVDPTPPLPSSTTPRPSPSSPTPAPKTPSPTITGSIPVTFPLDFPDIQCGGKTTDGPLRNGGTGDPLFPDLTYGAFKSGFRFAVAWTSVESYTGQLDYWIDSDPRVDAPVEKTEGTEGTAHLIVVDDLPVGSTLSFKVSDAAGKESQLHTIVLCNAHNAYSLRQGFYVVNLMTLSNEHASIRVIEEGIANYAIMLNDATDGWVKAGVQLIVFDDPESLEEGQTCADGPRCGMYDVVFSQAESSCYANGVPPTICAAVTTRDGIRDPAGQIFFNQLLGEGTGEPGSASWEVGLVLAHEFGHYGFGMLDYYPSGGLPGQDCNDMNGQRAISIMGDAGREATEYDDSFNRCPNEDFMIQNRGGYTPNWNFLVCDGNGNPAPTKLTEEGCGLKRYDRIPNRGALKQLPDPGPLEAGPVFLPLVLDMEGTILRNPPS